MRHVFHKALLGLAALLCPAQEAAPSSARAVVLTVLCLVLGTSTLSGAQGVTRLIVHKKQAETGPLPVQILDQATVAGYTVLADYDTMTVFKGPAGAAAPLLAKLQAQGRDAERPADLDSFSYHDHFIDADQGPTAPGTPGQLYFLTLQSYVKDVWFRDLEQQGVRVLQALGPVFFIVRAGKSNLDQLISTRPWLRGAFPVPVGVKAIGFEADREDAGPFREVVLRVSEESPAESLADLLASLSPTPISIVRRDPGQVTYQASLTDLDIENLARIDRVFELAPVGRPTISGERQAQLIAQPASVTNGESTLPAPNPGNNTYLQWLAGKGFSITANTFDNTKVGMIDTGFDNQLSSTFSYSGVHPDFKFTYLGQQITIPTSPETTGTFSYDDREYHGTITASIVAGYPASNRTDTDGYLFGLGIAPTVRLAIDKFISCTVPGGTVDQAMGRVTGNGANVVNMSFNLKVSEVLPQTDEM